MLILFQGILGSDGHQNTAFKAGARGRLELRIVTLSISSHEKTQ